MVNHSQVILFHVDEYDRVYSEVDQEAFIASTSDLSKLDVKIIGNAKSSLVAITGVADFFDVRWEWEYEWAFAENEYIETSVLVAIVNGG